MKKSIIGLCVATVFSTQAAGVHHVHTADCADAVKASPFTVTINELQSKVMAAAYSTQTAVHADVVVDLMAFYQPSYSQKMGEQWVHERIQRLVDNTNIGLANSGIKATIRLVNAQPISGIPNDLHYYDINPSDRILSPYGSNGGYPENIIYTAMGADLALYIRDYDNKLQPENALGFGELGGELSTVFDTATLPESDPLYLQGDFVLAHEIGHNFEAGHLSDDGGYTFLPAAHAYVCAGKATIMGPADPNGHRFYSSPEKFVNGEACGIAGVADNTSIIKSTIVAAANRRSAPDSVGGVSFASSAYKIEQGDLTYSVSLVRTGNLAEAASVQVALFDDTAKEGKDFLTSFERVEFAAGESEAVFTVQLTPEASGKAKLAMRYPYKLTIENGQADLVLSDLPIVVGDFTFTRSSISVSESVGKFTLTVARENGSGGEHAVRVYTVNGTRLAGTDYQGFDTTLVFADGETSKSFDVTVLDNSIVDDAGIFYVRLDAMGANAIVSEVVVSITNNDQPAVEVEPSRSGGSVGLWSLLLCCLFCIRRNKFFTA